MSKNTDNTSAREAFEYLVGSLGTPTVHSVHGLNSTVMNSGYDATWLQIPGDDTGTFHPVFSLAHHFRSKDSYEGGYTSNHARGDHLSIPGYTESGDIAVIDVSFHKGSTSMTVLTFEDEPEASNEVEGWRSSYRAALKILREHETR